MKNIYISGPISGYDIFERRRAFNDAAKKVRQFYADKGEEVAIFTPTCNGLPLTASYAEHMRKDIATLTESHLIYFMPEWEKSRGCRLEFEVSQTLSIPILRL